MTSIVFLCFVALFTSQSIIVNSLPEKRSLNIFNKCYDEYGCFTILPPFGGTLQRPVAVLPQSPSVVATRFFLYTREHLSAVEIGRNKTKLSLGTWQSQRMTRVVIHGMIENYQAPWYDDMRKAFFETEDSNLIFVDWSKTNRFPYTQATANTQMVGAEIALLINELISEHGADPMLIHIIGHSLGAHAAGYAGSRISPKVSRITGLDPAGPYFEFTDPRVRLDPTDGQFVDIIHTDGQAHVQLGLGLLQPIGHADFYPNGGLEQPKCARMTGKIWNTLMNAFDNEGFVNSVLCSHLFSVYLFTDSIRNSNCSYISVDCSSMNQLKNTDECARNSINQMGIKASPNSHGTFYSSTQDADLYPYCQHLYSITLNVGNENVQIIGRIQLNIEQLPSITFDQQINALFKANSNLTRIFSFDQSLNDINTISISLKSTLGQPFQPIREITVVDIERQKSFTFCPTINDNLRFARC